MSVAVFSPSETISVRTYVPSVSVTFAVFCGSRDVVRTVVPSFHVYESASPSASADPELPNASVPPI
jgi:hypothetical protein